MSATSAPFGLRPAYFPTGLERAQALANGITSGYATSILKGQAVQYSPNAGVILPVLDTTTNSGLVSGACLTTGPQVLHLLQVVALPISTTINRSSTKSRLTQLWLKRQSATKRI